MAVLAGGLAAAGIVVPRAALRPDGTGPSGCWGAAPGSGTSATDAPLTGDEITPAKEQLDHGAISREEIQQPKRQVMV